MLTLRVRRFIRILEEAGYGQIKIESGLTQVQDGECFLQQERTLPQECRAPESRHRKMEPTKRIVSSLCMLDLETQSTKLDKCLQKQLVLNHVFKRFEYIEAQGDPKWMLWHMTGNRSYLIDYEEIDGGFVTFGGNQSNCSASTKACDDAGKARMETVRGKDYILLPVWPADPLFSQSLKDSPDVGFKTSGEEENKDAEDPGNEDSEVPSTDESIVNQEKDVSINSTNNINIVSPTVNVDGIEDNAVDEYIVYRCVDDPNMPELEDIVYSDDDEDVGAEADMNNLDAFMHVNPIPTTRIHKDHPIKNQIISGDFTLSNLNTQMDYKFKLQQVWTLMDLPNGKRAIGTKWVYRNKKYERGFGRSLTLVDVVWLLVFCGALDGLEYGGRVVGSRVWFLVLCWVGVDRLDIGCVGRLGLLFVSWVVDVQNK
ncbi:hypothetical protein Tco_0501684 [Tanacetum coccineum]